MSCSKWRCQRQTLENESVCPKHYRDKRGIMPIHLLNEMSMMVSKSGYGWLSAILLIHLVAIATTWSMMQLNMGSEANPFTATSNVLFGFIPSAIFSMIALTITFMLIWFYKKPFMRFMIPFLFCILLFDAAHDVILWMSI